MKPSVTRDDVEALNKSKKWQPFVKDKRDRNMKKVGNKKKEFDFARYGAFRVEKLMQNGVEVEDSDDGFD